MRRESTVKIYVGTSGYGHKEWKGVFYPAGIAAKEMLRFYAERLGAVEINYTYYHLPTESVLAAWAEQVPADFSFAIKASQIITHRKRLRKVAEENRNWRCVFSSSPGPGKRPWA
jgi:uncharacterized protein YecE (DUF72 family)